MRIGKKRTCSSQRHRVSHREDHHRHRAGVFPGQRGEVRCEGTDATNLQVVGFGHLERDGLQQDQELGPARDSKQAIRGGAGSSGNGYKAMPVLPQTREFQHYATVLWPIY